MTNEKLMQAAKKSRQRSYSPYSHFSVGAALLTNGGKIYTGANIENASYPATICAERVAIFKAISENERKFEKIAISGDCDDFCFPCGVCRQVMSEFCGDNFKIILQNKNEIKEFTLGELLPYSFKLKEDEKNEND